MCFAETYLWTQFQALQSAWKLEQKEMSFAKSSKSYLKIPYAAN